MKTDSARKVLFSLGYSFCLFFFSCNSIVPPKEVYVPIDYSEDDAVKEQFEYIRKMAEVNSIKALWRSALMMENLGETPDSKSLFADCCEKAVDELNLNIAENNLSDALRIARSLSAVSYSGKNMKMTEQQIESALYKDVPGSSKASVANASVAKMISGTVTVYVDKGIKIQRGVGYADSVLGSGFFISQNGYIVTNHHVISDMVDKKYEGYARLYIKLADDPDTRIPAKVVGYDHTLDIALLKTEIEAPYVFALGSSKDLSVGDKVYAIGSPLGLEKTLTSGIISSTDRQLFTAGTVFQIDAAVNSGNSGGPLIDEQGRVQAIVFAGVPNFQGLNFAIPVEYLKNELPFLFAGGEREHPWISAYGKTKRLPGSGARREGVQVFYCLPGGSADLAGIKKDDVIIAVNGIPVSSLDQLHVGAMKLESNIITRITVLTESGTTEDKIVYLEKRPSSPGYEIFRHDLLENAFYPMFGMKMVNSSTTNKRSYNIVSIIKGSVADETGFSENDPVQVTDITFSEDKSAAMVTLYAKKRKNGFLDVSMRVPAPMDSPNYF